LLYPKGKVSKIQEQQLCTVGGNVTALEVDGTFDDCQKMVKKAFLDPELKKRLNLSSANSINIARLLPQSLYYFHAYGQVHENIGEVCFSVPSGNFGNLSGGLLAAKMGLPVKKFIAASNINDIVPQYLLTGSFKPRPSVKTLSNAMDVGNPSNFARMLDLYEGDHDAMAAEIIGVSYTDAETQEVMKEIYDRYKYHLCPHSAIGYAGLRDKMKETGADGGIFLSTAHPSKFSDIVEPVTGIKPEMPLRLKRLIERKKQSLEMPASYDRFKSFLMNG
jgi:threonine synthase